MIENHELWNEIMDAAGPKKLRDVTGYDISTLYSFARNPMDVQHPDGTGARGILDRFEAVVDLLASRATSRRVLLKLQLRTMSLFKNALERGEARPADSAMLAARAVTALRELADVIDECGKADCDEEKLINETLEVQAILDEILRAADAGMVAEREAARPSMKVSR